VPVTIFVPPPVDGMQGHLETCAAVREGPATAGFGRALRVDHPLRPISGVRVTGLPRAVPRAGPTSSGRPLSLGGPRVLRPGHTMPRPFGTSDCWPVQVISLLPSAARAACVPATHGRGRQRSDRCSRPSAPKPTARRSSPATAR
jgi:hypothetical protein